MAVNNVGSGKLIVGMLGNADIASNLTDFLNFGEDSKRLTEAYSKNVADLSLTLQKAQALNLLGTKDGYTIIKQAITELPTAYNGIMQLKRNQLLQSSTGMKMTASMLGDAVRIFSQQTFADLYSTIVFDMPEAYVKEKVSRWYNSAFRNAILPSGVATQLRNMEKINEKRWREILAANGIPDKDMDLLLDLADKKPEMGTLLRMYQYIDMPDAAIEWLMTENGISMTQLRLLWKKYFHANRLRDEMLEYKQYLKRAYQAGQLTDAQLEAELLQFLASQEEVDQIITNQKAEFDRTLISNEFETRIWFYRKGVYGDEEPEQQLYDSLASLGVNSALVNATVRLEAAKKGVVWETE